MGRTMTDISAEQMLNAFSALEHLQPDSSDFLAEAARVLSKALEYPWTIILPCNDTASESGDAIAMHMDGDDKMENRAAITLAAQQLIDGNKDSNGQWTASIAVNGLGTLDVRGNPCRDSEGSVRGHLLALAPQSPQVSDEVDNRSRFAESFMALTAQRVGTRLGRQNNEQILQQSEENFHHLIENMPQGFFVNKGLQPVFFNRAMSDMYGYDSPEELLRAQSLTVLWAPHELDRIKQFGTARIQGDMSANTFEGEGVKKDGTAIWVQVVAQPIRWQGEVLIGGTVNDITALKMSQLELAEKSAVLETILQAAPYSVSLRDIHGRYVFINRRGAALHDLEPVDFLGKTQAEVFGQNTSQDIEELYEQTVRTGKAVLDIEVASSKFPGRIYSYGYAPVFDGEGKVTGIVAIARDVSEQKRAENALQENEQALTEAQRIGRIGHWRIYPDTGMVELSNQACRVLGFPEGEGLRELAELRKDIPAKDIETISRARAAGLEKREAYRFKYSITFGNGEVRVMEGEGQPEYDQSGALTSIFGVTQDVTDRDKIESELRQSEARLRDFAEASAEHYWQTDAQNRYDYFSSSYQESSNRSNDELIGQPVENATDPAFRGQESWQYIQSQMRQRQPFRDVVFERQGAKPGETVWIRASGRPYFNESGDFLGFRGTSNNVTTHRTLEEQLAQAQKMETVGQLTGGVAHDFNNLLAVIVGNAELLLHGDDLASDREVDKSKAKKSTDAILRAAYRGAELTQQLLAFSRKQSLSPKVINLDQQISGMITMLQGSLDATIDIQTSSSDDLWPCLVDPGQVENVMLNLAINARDAMPDGGTLSIETANAYMDDESAAQADIDPGAYVTLAVTDTGTGMPAEVRDKIFEPFFTTKDQGKGTGLGLSMVFGFVKQSDGHVTVYSEEGRGTTIKLYLPRASRQPDEARNFETSSPGARDECVLIVEDDTDVRTLAVNLIDDLGYRVLEAGDGKAALGILERERRIDLLFTDVILPGGMNGNEIARRAPEYQPDIKIMYMSGYSHDALIHQGRMDDAVVLLQKPFRRAELAVKLREALENPPKSDKAVVP